MQISVLCDVTRPNLIDQHHCFGRTVPNMDAAGSSETFVTIFYTIRRHIPEELEFNTFLTVFGFYMFRDSSGRKTMSRSAVGST
jgi:hypothetical protein